MIKAYFVRSIYEPLYSQIYRKDNRLKHYTNYKRYQWRSLEKNKDDQAQALYKLILYASKNIPYYRKVIKEHKIYFSKETIFDDIRKFPILTKDIIREEFKNLYKIIPGVRWYYNTSGGSTGEPIKLVQDFDYEARAEAMTRLQYEWAGFKLGETMIKLWGSERDILKEKEGFKHKFANWIKSTYLLNAFMMTEENMESYVFAINKRKPRLILAYVQSIYELARYIEKNNLKIFSPKAVMTSAGTLYPSFKDMIRKVFRCPVFNRYGSREVGNLACECKKQEGLHIDPFNHYIEILDKKLRPCKEGEIGEIYVTLLTNYSMPLIRYKIGDLAIPSKKMCSCGRGLPLIKNVVGRSNSMIKTNKGVFDSVAISALLYFFKEGVPFQSFSKYQLTQKSKNKIILKVIIADFNLWKSEKERIKEKFRKVLGSEVEIIFKEVNEIPPLKSGKYSYILNEMKE